MSISAPSHRAGNRGFRADSGRLRAGVRLAAVVGLDIAAIITFTAAGSRPWATVDWFSSATWTATDPEVVVVAVLRLLGLGVAYWVAATTAIYVVGRIARLPRVVRSVEWATLPIVRRAADKVVALSVVTSTLASPATALAHDAWLQYTPPIPVVVVAQSAEPDTDRGPIPRAAPLPVRSITPQLPVTPDVGPAVGAIPPVDPLPLAPPDTGRLIEVPPTHVVAVGDSLWSIAERHMATVRPDASGQEIARFWGAVVDTNRSSLRSGDPDLIFPGEIVTLPALEDS